MVDLSLLQTTLTQATPVRMDRYSPLARLLQHPKVPRKARVGIPTAKHLQTHGQHKRVKDEPFHELPEGVDVDNMEWMCTGSDQQPILEIPAELRKLFGHEAKELYTTEYGGLTGVWYAVLFGLDPEFVTRTFASQLKCVKELKHLMSIELDDYYQTYKYRQYGYKKSAMDKVLMHSDEYDSTLGHFVSDFLDVNVLVLLENRRFHWLGRFDEARVTLVVYHRGMQWGAIVHPDQRTHLFNATQVQALTKAQAHMVSLDATQQHSHLVKDARLLTRLKREIKGKKLRDLQDMATTLELLIEDDVGKKKLKRVLQEEIYKQLTGCDDF